MAAGSLGELFIELGIFADTKELKQFEDKLRKVDKQIKDTTQNNDKLTKSIGNFLKGMVGVASAIGGAIYALNRLTTSLIESNQQFLNLTRTSDISLSTFQKWDSVGKMFGVRNAAQQIENLNQKLFELKLTGQGAEGFMLAGINPMGQDASGIMEQLRSRVAGLDDTAAAYLLRQMGLDPSMLHLLRLGREEFEELGATIDKYRLTDDQVQQIQAMNVQLQIAQIKLRYLKDRAILALMPYFVRLMDSLAKVAELLARWAKGVGEFVVKWRSLIVAIGVALAKLTPLGKLFSGLLVSIGGLISKIPIFGRALATLGGFALKALLPFTALYLLLDDIATFMEGGDSLIGRVGDWLNETGSDFSSIFGKMFGGDMFGGIRDLLIKIVDILDDFVMVIGKLLARLTGLPVDKWFQNFANFASGGNYDALKNYDYGARTSQTNHNVNTNNINNDNKQVTMNYDIYTTQVKDAVVDDLAAIQYFVYKPISN